MFIVSLLLTGNNEVNVGYGCFIRNFDWWNKCKSVWKSNGFRMFSISCVMRIMHVFFIGLGLWEPTKNTYVCVCPQFDSVATHVKVLHKYIRNRNRQPHGKWLIEKYPDNNNLYFIAFSKFETFFSRSFCLWSQNVQYFMPNQRIVYILCEYKILCIRVQEKKNPSNWQTANHMNMIIPLFRLTLIELIADTIEFWLYVDG